ncbi:MULTISPECIES: helix-turn-helix transcriptional regulator [Pectobacterium]|uniref:helix-turn-helix transcriptional regulator n=1 Tax=Pectobacterium TaxID=122277 RepID=UPI00202D84FD|nr:helix-turn-helix transcriptional regulator [Pectobacterium carotovorum]MCL6397243.1 XRE family transcriptional regulator [Pectobacterium carotovorum subsp. carotovorum]
MTLAERVKKRRQELSITQAQLAGMSGVSQQAINRIESGLISRPRYILEMSRALQCEAEWLQYGNTQQRE